ncbi:DUF4280 domain-containing protein [Chitinophaga sp. 212800010-3]|uniref:DUF4280 domain-containing protein n=1 Tax=unclassified Chitinophaga TaxID=2619133 RepID=UPI002DE3FF47|nr:DUF4280 domain-containing protein [Chitinophaga sp. 212800010-3]
MSEKHLVCQGAVCMCQFGTTPDKLKVKSQQVHYINDKDGAEKPLATTKDIGQPFENNSFGSCSKKNNNPCTPSVTAWSGSYDKVELPGGAHILLEDSKATCPTGSTDCIRITFHGQTADMTKKDAEKADKEVQSHLNPMMDVKKVEEDLYMIELLEGQPS